MNNNQAGSAEQDTFIQRAEECWSLLRHGEVSAVAGAGPGSN